MSAAHDRKFFDTFMLVLGILAAVTIGLIIVAGIISRNSAVKVNEGDPLRQKETLERIAPVARVAVGAQASLSVWGWAVSQFPYLIPPDLTIRSAAAPAATLRPVAIALGLGTAVLLPSLVYLFRVFKAAPSHSVRRPKGEH